VRLVEALGILATALFSVLFISSLATRPLIYDYWGESLGRSVRDGVGELGRVLSEYVWKGFFPVLTGVIILLLSLVVGVASLLRGSDE